MVPKSGHVTMTNTDTCRKKYLFQKCYSFRSTRLRFNVLSIDYVRVTNCFYDYDFMIIITKLSRKNRFRKVASPGACGVFGTLQF